MTNKEKKNLYMKERNRINNIIRRLKKQGYEVDYVLPKIPEKITIKDIRSLQDVKPITIQKKSYRIYKDPTSKYDIKEYYIYSKNKNKKTLKTSSSKRKREYAARLEKQLFNAYKEEGLISSSLYHKSTKINEKLLDDYIKRLEGYLGTKIITGELLVLRKKKDVRIKNAVTLLDDYGAPTLSKALYDYAKTHSFKETELVIKKIERVVKINLWDSDQPAKGISNDMIDEGLKIIEEA